MNRPKIGPTQKWLEPTLPPAAGYGPGTLSLLFYVQLYIHTYIFVVLSAMLFHTVRNRRDSKIYARQYIP